jgi:hypothetical protein
LANRFGVIWRTCSYNQEGVIMQPPSQPEPGRNAVHAPVAEHVAGAHQLLKALQDKIGQHPELAEAITELELALSILTVKTAGML